MSRIRLFSELDAAAQFKAAAPLPKLRIVRIVWERYQRAQPDLQLCEVPPETRVLAIQFGKHFYYTAFLREQCARIQLAKLKQGFNSNTLYLFRARPRCVVDFSTLRKVF